MSVRTPVVALLLLAAGCQDNSPPPREFDGQAAFGYLKAQVDFGYRIPGTESHDRTGAWIDSVVRSRADTVINQTWDHTTASGKVLPLHNIVARFNPGASERLLFLAHWDTRPVSDNPSYQGDHSHPVPGANDGASGVAVLLGVADALKAKPAKVGVDLLFVDGEDYGDFSATPGDVLIGSRYYGQHLVPGPRPSYAVLFDLVADKDLRIYQEGNSLLGSPDVVDMVWNVARKRGYGQIFVAQTGPTLIDDHVELQKVGIRAIDVVDFNYPDSLTRLYWHTPDDTIDKVSEASLQIVGDVAMALVRAGK